MTKKLLKASDAIKLVIIDENMAGYNTSAYVSREQKGCPLSAKDIAEKL